MISARRLLAGTFLLIAGAAAVWLLRPAREWLRADSCLEAGGRWDYAGHACELALERPAGRLVLRSAAADELALHESVLVEVDSSAVPSSARAAAERLRQELDGGAAPVRYFGSGDGRQFAALVPSRSFEGEDPHVVAAFGHQGQPIGRAALPTFASVEVYCPGAAKPVPASSARDSTDGCRYFFPPLPENPPRQP